MQFLWSAITDGVIIDPESQIGNRLNELIAGFRCNYCTEKLNEELRLANGWGRLGGDRGNNSEVSATNVRCDVSEVAAANGTDSLAAVDSTSEITNTNTLSVIVVIVQVQMQKDRHE